MLICELTLLICELPLLICELPLIENKANSAQLELNCFCWRMHFAQTKISALADGILSLLTKSAHN